MATCLRSRSSRLRTLASSTMFPTCSTRPPSTSGSTLLESSTLRPVCSSIRLPMSLTSVVVELDRARDAHRQQLVLLGPERRRSCGGCGTAPASGGARRAARGSSRSARRRPPRACRCPPSSPARRSRARRRTPGGRGSRSSASANCAQLVVDAVERVVLDRRPRRGRASRPRRSLPPSPSLPVAGERREVDLVERLLDQAAVVVVVERLAGDLLGGHHRQVGDLLADLVERPAGLRLDVLARGLHQLLAVLLGVGLGLVLARARRPCGRGRRCRRPARAPPSGGRGTPRAARRPPAWSAPRPRSTPGSPWRACRAPRRCAGRRAPQDQERDAEGDQRPDHQPELGRDQEAAALVLLAAAACSWASRNMSRQRHVT